MILLAGLVLGLSFLVHAAMFRAQVLKDGELLVDGEKYVKKEAMATKLNKMIKLDNQFYTGMAEFFYSE